MQKIEPLEHGQYYHIYNCGINGQPLFRETTNYEHFLKLYDKYITPIAETYAWCLMGNHFHLLMRIKDAVDVVTTPDRVLNPVRGVQNDKPLHLYFSHLFNSYTQAYNKMYSRHGSLFERPFKRKRIDSETYLKQVFIYIHNNPVHHGFCNHPLEYAWSSYLPCMTSDPEELRSKLIVTWFKGIEQFENAHRSSDCRDDIDKYLEL